MRRQDNAIALVRIGLLLVLEGIETRLGTASGLAGRAYMLHSNARSCIWKCSIACPGRSAEAVRLTKHGTQRHSRGLGRVIPPKDDWTTGLLDYLPLMGFV